MEHITYRYEVEAEWLRAHKCPRCKTPLVNYPKDDRVHCASGGCGLKIERDDFHPSQGWCVFRGKKDNRPEILTTA